MKNYIKSKRSQFIIILAFFCVYLALFVVTRLAVSLKVIEFAFLTIAFGFAPAYYFRNAIKFRNLIGWIAVAGTMGMIFIPFLILFLGWLRINIIFEYSQIFLYLVALVGILSLFFVDESKLHTYLTVRGIKIIDVIVIFVFLVFSVILTLHTFYTIEIHWDSFTYWGIDAKYIYEHNQFRDKAFHTDIMIFRYTSFHPIYFALIYDIYGAIVEQFATWINVYVNFLAMVLIYLFVNEKTTVHKSLTAGSILFVSYSAITIVNMFSMYADVLTGFLLLIYFLILINDFDITPDTYWQRFFLLLLISISFYFIKSPFLYFTLILIGVLLLYDAKFILKNRIRLFRNAGFIFSVLGVITLLVMRGIYFAKVGGTTAIEERASNFSVISRISTFSSFNSLVEYVIDLAQYMIGGTPYFLGFWCLTLLSIFFVKDISKRYIYLFLSTLLISLLPVAGYILSQREFNSQSLLRYSAIVMYLFPLMIGFIKVIEDKFRKLASYSVFGLVTLFVFINIMYPMPLVEKFTLSKGTFQSGLTKYYNFAENVLDLTGPDARILIADDLPDSTITNMMVPEIFVRYYMQDNSVGSQYRASTDSLIDLVSKYHTDYILLLSYVDSFENCERYLLAGRDYLIDIRDSDFSSETGSCQFSPFEIIDLGEAIR